MALWSPLLVAIAFKKLEIVKYFLHEVGASYPLWGCDPSSPFAIRFGLEIAAAN
jgi:hypothetical protein